MSLYSPLSIVLRVIYEIYFQRGGRGLLSKLPFPCFGKLYLTDFELESSAVGGFDLLHVAAITLSINFCFFPNKNVNSHSIMNSSKSRKEVSVYEINWLLSAPLAAACSTNVTDDILILLSP